MPGDVVNRRTTRVLQNDNMPADFASFVQTRTEADFDALRAAQRPLASLPTAGRLLGVVPSGFIPCDFHRGDRRCETTEPREPSRNVTELDLPTRRECESRAG